MAIVETLVFLTFHPPTPPLGDRHTLLVPKKDLLENFGSDVMRDWTNSDSKRDDVDDDADNRNDGHGVGDILIFLNVGASNTRF